MEKKTVFDVRLEFFWQWVLKMKEKKEQKIDKKIRKHICSFLKLCVVKYTVRLHLRLNIVNISLNCIKKKNHGLTTNFAGAL